MRHSVSDDLASLLFPGPSWIKLDWDSWAFSCSPVLWLMHIFIHSSFLLPSNQSASPSPIKVYFIFLFSTEQRIHFVVGEGKMDRKRNRERKLISFHWSLFLAYKHTQINTLSQVTYSGSKRLSIIVKMLAFCMVLIYYKM